MEPQFETKTSPTLEGVIHIGHSVFVKGELSGDENLTIDGRVEGKIGLKDHNLVVGPNGKIKAEINAKNVTVLGSVVGNIYASERVEIQSTGSVVGDIRSSGIAIADGAHLKGSVTMESGGETTETNPPKAESANVSHKQSSGKIGLAAIPK